MREIEAFRTVIVNLSYVYNAVTKPIPNSSYADIFINFTPDVVEIKQCSVNNSESGFNGILNYIIQTDMIPFTNFYTYTLGAGTVSPTMYNVPANIHHPIDRVINGRYFFYLSDFQNILPTGYQYVDMYVSFVLTFVKYKKDNVDNMYNKSITNGTSKNQSTVSPANSI